MPQSILKVISAWAAITHNSSLMAEISCRLCTTNDDTHLFGLLKIRKVNLTSSSCWSLPLPCISLPKSILSKEWWENIAPWIFNSPFTHLFSIKFQFLGQQVINDIATHRPMFATSPLPPAWVYYNKVERQNEQWENITPQQLYSSSLTVFEQYKLFCKKLWRW